jgi:hypothetical protein
MKPNDFTKHYGTLSVWERIPLLVAAYGRQDETERQRLAEKTINAMDRPGGS